MAQTLPTDSVSQHPNNVQELVQSIVNESPSLLAEGIRHALFRDLISASEAGSHRGENYSLLGAKLRLFAPAHLGYTITGICGLLLEMPGINYFGKAFLRFSTSAKDIQPDSPVLETVRTRTEERASTYGDTIPALRADVLWGGDEKIVYVGSYEKDNEIDPITGQDHFSICKPNWAYRIPLEFVEHGSLKKSTAV